ncbi:MAG: hypothetical protein CVU56_13435 [Deltaproteobacteria bacterium HGW-Deltaproteobacteria-14]|jgi:hypothetical protein|nr:MAG: hypothetical protein CVU56_13435 [Deltaproteobacteria bacterium HGW-Deltaproteobacteria-14]
MFRAFIPAGRRRLRYGTVGCIACVLFVTSLLVAGAVMALNLGSLAGGAHDRPSPPSTTTSPAAQRVESALISISERSCDGVDRARPVRYGDPSAAADAQRACLDSRTH